MNRHSLPVLAFLLAVASPRAALADYSLSPWPDPETPPLAPRRDEPAPPPPNGAPHFGSAGTLAVFAAAGVSSSHVDSYQTSGTIDLAYFFQERISLGVEVIGSTFQYRGDAIASYGGGPRAGYAIPLTDRLTLLPALGLVYGAMYLPSLAPPPGKEIAISQHEHHGVTLSADAFLLLQLPRDLFVGVDVSLREDLTNYTLDPVYDTKQPMIAGLLTFGGWLQVGETIPPGASATAHRPL
jgi:hypothetical protein